MKIVRSNFDIDDVLSAIGGGDSEEGGTRAAGAVAGTAVMPGIGTVIGGAIAPLITKLFSGGQPSQWEGAGAGVHDWFTRYGSQDFLDWMRKYAPNGFGSVDNVIALFPVYLRSDEYRRISGIGDGLVWPDEAAKGFYKQGVTEEAYRQMGVDYPATLEAERGRPNKPHPFVMLPGFGSPQMPQAVVDAAKDAADRIARGEGTQADRTLMDLINSVSGDLARAVSQGATEGANAAGGVSIKPDLSGLIPWIIGGLLALVVIIFMLRRK